MKIEFNMKVVKEAPDELPTDRKNPLLSPSFFFSVSVSVSVSVPCINICCSFTNQFTFFSLLLVFTKLTDFEFLPFF